MYVEKVFRSKGLPILPARNCLDARAFVASFRARSQASTSKLKGEGPLRRDVL